MSGEGGQRPVVLMIEDDQVVRALVRRQLVEEGYDVREAASGDEGLSAAEAVAPDVILLDLKLPGALQGLDVLDAISRSEQVRDIPVIVLSGDVRALPETLTRGAHDFLGKPYAGVELQARVAAAVRNRRLHEELRAANERLAREALADALTGLGNRRLGMIELERMSAHAIRQRESLALLQLDVDNFKTINDRHGHQAGDALLQRMATALLSVLRAEDVLVRWGGDEFVALLPNADASAALAVAERLRMAGREAGIEWDAHVLSTTVSIGWTCLEESSAEDLLACADAALYEAKRAGRDAVSPAA